METRRNCDQGLGYSPPMLRLRGWCHLQTRQHPGSVRNALQAKTSQGADADAARVRALAAYKDFFVLWKDADP